MNGRRKSLKTVVTFPCLARVACVAALLLVARPQPGLSYELTWSTIDCGGGTSSGGPYVLHGTIGQPEAASCAGGLYALTGGFWPNAVDLRGIFAALASEPLVALSGPYMLPWTCLRTTALATLAR
ncbi:MAG: hypothetical protein JW741_28555 [Sedimentisphaerales bacterium]|nr:hypothetical protein [Sedimentisphaerales bacterium]